MFNKLYFIYELFVTECVDNNGIYFDIEFFMVFSLYIVTIMYYSPLKRPEKTFELDKFVHLHTVHAKLKIVSGLL